MAHDVFISYSDKDKAVAEAVCAALESKNIRCWIAPRDIQASAVWAEAVVDAIDGSRCFLLIFSSDSNSSRQVVREVERAVVQGVAILPLRVDDAPLSKAMQFYIDRYHWLDARTKPLKKHLQQLAQTIQDILAEGRPVSEAVRAPEKKEKPAISIEPQPVLDVDCERLDFADVKPGSRVTRSFNISNAGDGRLTGTITTTQPWIKVSPDRVDLKKGKQKLSVIVDTSDLAPGFEGAGEIDIDTNGGQAKVAISLSVVAVPEPQPILNIDCQRLDLADVRPGSRVTRSFNVSNTGTGRLTGSITTTDLWIKVSPDRIDLEKGEKKVQVTVDTSSLDSGFEGSGDIKIDTNGGQSKVAIGLSIIVEPEPEPVLDVDCQRLNFADIKPGSRVTRSFSVSNAGDGKLTGTITTNRSWLKVSPDRIDLEKGDKKVQVTVDGSDLAPGFEGAGDVNINTNGGRAKVAINLSVIAVPEPQPIARPRTGRPIPRSLIIIVGAVLAVILSGVGIYFAIGRQSTKPAVIQDVSVSDINTTGAVITWTTDKPATSLAEYGRTADLGLSTALGKELVTSHSVKITGLEPDTTCYFRVWSKGAGGEEAVSETGQLTTLAVDTAPPVISEVTVAGYTGETATITWETDEDSSGQVEYGTTDAYGKLAAADSELITGHSIELTGLQPNTAYHFRVKTKDGQGNEAMSVDQAFTSWVAEPDWKEYVNDEYGFSIRYPIDWAERPDLLSTPYHLAAFGVSKYIPGVSIAVFDNPPAETVDWILRSSLDLKQNDPRLSSDITEETLADGTPAYAYKMNFGVTSASALYEVTSYILDSDRDGKRFRVNVFTMEGYSPYDEQLFSQIAHTLRFTTEN